MIVLPNHPGIRQSIRSIKGVGAQIEKALNRRGYNTVADLAGLMPAKYQDRRGLTPISKLAPETEALTAGEICSVREGRFPSNGRKYFEVVIRDGEDRLSALWFSFPMHLQKSIRSGNTACFFGRVQAYKDRLQMVHPEIISWDGSWGGIPEIRPVYPLMDDVKPGVLRRIMAEVAGRLAGLPAVFPISWLEKHELTDPLDALRTLHAPPGDRPGAVPVPENTRAWRNLAVFELLLLQIALARSRRRFEFRKDHTLEPDHELVRDFLDRLPFDLTVSQQDALEEIAANMARQRRMNRLLQGDVGSGKTAVAVGACLLAVGGGRQAAIMAPTEILARQHHDFLQRFVEPLGVRIGLLVGSLAEAEKRDMATRLAAGEIDLVTGTQALISEAVNYKSLGLAVIDEQHRFGVAQRLALRAKADAPDLLVMTATPIPRTLAMTVYGDLEMTVIKGLPPSRRPVRTAAFEHERRDEAYRMLAEEIKAGGQAFVVGPRIENGDDGEVSDGPEAVTDIHRRLTEDVLPGLAVGLLHGRLDQDEQQRVLDDFREGRIQVLTATTIIEVGIDVPRANLILIENADRFGLAQLHQLRGRVGRGERPGLCLLLAGPDGDRLGRLEVMAGTDDGFILAEEDLRRRGPGDAAGLRQSGLPDLTWARLPADLPLLLKARDLAEEIVGRDPELADPSFKLVREAVDEMDKKFRTEASSIG